MKTKNNINDLAIFNGPPAFKKKLHVGRPNTGKIKNFKEKIDKIFEDLWFTNKGPFVKELEEKIAKYLNVKNFIVVTNGTLGLEIAAKALNLTGEVIVPSFTFVATPHSLQWVGLNPVFCDIDPNTHNIDPMKARALINSNTSAILGVHVWGRPCDIDSLKELAEEKNIKLYFDAAHAFGCSYKGKMIGNFGSAEVFSFHATKFFNTFEGGGIATNDDSIAEKIRLMCNFGFSGYDNVMSLGINAKMTEVCAAMGLTCMEDIDAIISKNYQNYNIYKEELKNINGIKIVEYDETERNNFQYIILDIEENKLGISRDFIIKILHAENILARRYFYPGCHQMKPYNEFIMVRDDLSYTESLSRRVISLPTGTSILEEDIRIICFLIKYSIENADAIKVKIGSE